MSKSYQKTMRITAAAVLLLGIGTAAPAWANNLRITNVSLEARDRQTSSGSVVVEFDISWDNTWRNHINHDAVWIFLKVSTDGGTTWVHGNMMDTGNDPTGTSPGSNNDLEIYVPTDKTGAFIRRRSTAQALSEAQTTAQSKDVQLRLNYYTITGNHSAEIKVQVHGIEMVYIPRGAFYAGDTASFNAFSDQPAPTFGWFISSDDTLAVGPGSQLFYNQTSNTPGVNQYADGVTFSIPRVFPLGFNPFYAMKYEITEGQWVAFLNDLPSSAQVNLNPFDGGTGCGSKAGTAVYDRNTISGTSTPISTARPDRAVSCLSFPMLAAYLDWAALRPMTELEFEKMARGPLAPVAGEYAWGTASYAYYNTFSISPENGTETLIDGINISLVDGSGASRRWYHGDTIFSTVNRTQGPARVGLYADQSAPSAGRVPAGAGYYGNMELSGNVWEQALCVGNSIAITTFDGTHGDGAITSTGRANFSVAKWAGTAVVLAGSSFSGRRGGGWNSPTREFRTSQRDAANIQASAQTYNGGRGVRTVDTADETAAGEQPNP